MTKFNPRNPAALGAALSGDWENALVASTPGGIEAQEALAQQDLIESQKLPKEGTIQPTYNHQDLPSNQVQLEALGFVFGEEVDDLFVSCQLPKGWTLQPTDHSMWSKVLDGKGRTRMMVFYKGAFYDRRAHANIEQRFHILQWDAASPDLPEQRIDYSTDAWKTVPVCIYVKDHDGSSVFASQAFGQGDQEAEQAAYRACDDWLEKHYPDYKNPFAYWE